ncbi:trypsin-like peptidase domain-containing protein [soil metagenome]
MKSNTAQNAASINLMNKGKVIAFSLITVFVIAGSVLAAKFFLPNGFKNFQGPASPKDQREESNKQITDSRQTSITKIISRISPAIVGINVEEEREVQDPFSQFWGNDPFFQQYFGNRGGNQKQVVKSLGSGYIISTDGYILTNDHVAGNATKISVVLTTGESVSAKLIGSDKVSDVALLKIDKGNLPYLNLGNSDDVMIGEWAIALGNPFGLFEINDKPTVTVGVISAVDMKVAAQDNRVYRNMLQTDASINAGNSGGPLVNVDGDVIGMNTIIFTGGNYSSGSIGVGFAISINRVKKIMEDLKKYGKIERATNVGFNIQAIDDRIAKYYDLPNKMGVIVTQVQKGSVSSEAGLQPEDIITEVDGIKIKNEQDLILEINDLRKGDEVHLKIIRNKSEKTIDFTLK